MPVMESHVCGEVRAEATGGRGAMILGADARDYRIVDAASMEKVSHSQAALSPYILGGAE